ncbi:MAG: molybdopterin-dependent oxidoreductase [Nitriliruptorales bacterium]|nr:molybdopterin-dependent oxidoreductase [Nitriliruptorales bacterium]
MAEVRRTCQWCEATCGLVLDVVDNTIVSVTGDPDDPLSQGYLCPKGVAAIDVGADPDRLRTPRRRRPDGTFVEIGWDEAFDLVGKNIRRIRREHGNDAVATYIGNTAGTATAAVQIGMAVDALRTRNQYAAASMDQAPQSLVSWLLYGHQYLFGVPDLDRTDHLLIIGANPLVSNGSLVSAPDWKRRIRAIQARDGHVAVVDPRRTETARVADAHHRVRPGTDVLLLAAMISTIERLELVDPGSAAGYLDGLEELLAAVRGVTPDVAAPIVGIEADEIVAMARAFATAKSAVAYSRIGPCLTRHGTAASWLVVALNIVTGNFDRPGGLMFSTPAFDLPTLARLTRRNGSYDAHRSRVRNLPELGGELPISTLADEIETPGEGQIRALFLIGGNIVRSAPNGRRLDRALAGLDFIVAVDPYINETTRHADVVLPPMLPLEREHYDFVFASWAVRNAARISPPAIEPHPDAMAEEHILLELSLQFAVGLRERLAMGVVRLLRPLLDPMRTLDVGLRLGPWGLRRGRDGLSVRRLREVGHTVDLGPLEPRMPKRLFTKGRRLDLAPALLVDALAEAVADLTTDGGRNGELTLIGRRQLRTKNTWMHNSERLVKGRDRCTLLIHPDDADRFGVQDEQAVRVTSRVGQIELPAEVSDEIGPGVVSIPHGWGHDVEGNTQTIAMAHPGASVNDLTDDRILERLTGNAGFNAVPVTVAPAPALAAT